MVPLSKTTGRTGYALMRNGFRFAIKRSHDFRATGTIPTKRIPLQWVGKEFFDERAMFNSGKYKVDQKPVCYFEACAHKVKVPEKTLRAVDDKVSSSNLYPLSSKHSYGCCIARILSDFIPAGTFKLAMITLGYFGTQQAHSEELPDLDRRVGRPAGERPDFQL